jgi:response regulator RpfG family c-di-GMP phosphodiesterase
MDDLLPRESTILLVDDETEIVSSLKMAIERTLPRVRVLTAPDGKTGLEVLDRERVDVILSDQNMPGMLGIEFLSEARRRAPTIARIMLTAFPNEQVAMSGINDARLDHFFTKPFRLGDVVARIQSILEEQHQRDVSRLAFARSIEVLRQEADRAAAQAPIPMRKTPRPFRGDLL